MYRNDLYLQSKIPTRYQAVHWWPTPNTQFSLPDVVPVEVQNPFDEGCRCAAVSAPNAAVAMFRNAIAAIVQIKGSDEANSKNTLFLTIQQMGTDGTLFNDFTEWAHHVRLTGNAGAHQEQFEDVTSEQASDLREFTRQLIEFLFVQPARRKNAMPTTRRAVES
ncbi:DUF4145 domain-containing protein [Williamsia sp.]|uniref:DUF4145 domain-containing protein n=1 Tax=Williamsia sp. TaxID=1872085 RepID=UPI001A221A3E|nr:DUF4145 domain-containing protein [Williamsia sp.]MBJ7289409.1 DUF4145 domain-containing protein [Williamsia sp.]